MSKLLIKYESNYADEFDVEGFWITDCATWEDQMCQVEHGCPFPQERYFGTNECVFYEDFDEYKSCFTVISITDEEYEVIKKLFGTSHGDFLSLEGYF